MARNTWVSIAIVVGVGLLGWWWVGRGSSDQDPLPLSTLEWRLGDQAFLRLERGEAAAEVGAR